MIRANLLPRRKETIGFAGFEVDTEYVRQLVLGMLIVATVAVLGIAMERLRLQRLDAAASIEDGLIASHAQQRSEAKSLALEVARYQGFAREARALRRSGADAAITVARIGNDVPERVWLNTFDRATDGFDLTGGSYTVDALGRTMLSLGRTRPGAATLIAIDNRNAGAGGVKFSAHVATSTPLVPAATTIAADTPPGGVGP